MKRESGVEVGDEAKLIVSVQKIKTGSKFEKNAFNFFLN